MEILTSGIESKQCPENEHAWMEILQIHYNSRSEK
jgi:hypothetical protein